MNIKNFFHSIAISGLFFLSACQSAPTKSVQTVGGDPDKILLVDVRNSFQYSSYHISGSVNLVSDDFLILTNPENKTRKFDPDFSQTLERLAKKGVSPLKKIILIDDEKNSVEVKKWAWLLKQVNVADVHHMTMSEYIVQNRPLRPRPNPLPSEIWTVDDVKQIMSKSDECFVNWVDSCPHGLKTSLPEQAQ